MGVNIQAVHLVASPNPADITAAAAGTHVAAFPFRDVAGFCVWNLHITEAGTPNLVAERIWEKCQLWACSTKGTCQKFIRIQRLCISAHFMCTVAIVPAGLYLCAKDIEPSLLTKLLRGLACFSLPRECAPGVVTGVGTPDCGLEWRMFFFLLSWLKFVVLPIYRAVHVGILGPGVKETLQFPLPRRFMIFFLIFSLLGISIQN